jgi:hypothetical protein
VIFVAIFDFGLIRGGDMQDYILIVYSNAADGRHEEFNAWYNNVHLPDVLALPHFTSARRFKLIDFKLDEEAPNPTHQYVAYYHLSCNDPNTALSDLRDRVLTGKILMSETMGPDFQAVAYQAVSENMLADC